MTMTRKKKYANGTGTSGIPTYIPSPNQTLQENTLLINQAEAEAGNNVWTSTIIPIIGQIAGSMASKGNFMAKQPGSEAIAAMGNSGTTGSIEVEGKEVLETPAGQTTKVKGPSHEAGGVDANVPDGTKIYSDRIKVAGKTMAERKEAREKRLFNLDKTSATRTGDLATRNSVARSKEIIEAEEASDLAMQEMANAFTKMQTFAMGTGPDGINKYALGTGEAGIDPEKDPLGYFLANLKRMGTDIPALNPYGETPLKSTDVDAMDLSRNEGVAIDLTNNKSGYSNLELAPTASNTSSNAKSTSGAGSFTPTAGDFTSVFGNLISAFGPMRNTLESRATDTPNVNSFKDFGKEGLAANQDAMDTVSGQEDNALNRIKSNTRGSKRSFRNSARGVNQQRAFDLAADMGANSADTEVYDAFSKQMMQLFTQKAGLENQQDQVVMGGEAGRDLANRQDKDNFYTQKAKDIATMGTGIQQTGKDLNAISQNEMYMNMLNQMSKYFQFDSKGQIIGINQTTK